MINPSVISEEVVIKKVIRSNCIDKAVTEIEAIDLIIAEYLRKTLYNFSCVRQNQFEPTFITRLINSVQRQLRVILQGKKFIKQKDKEDIYSDKIRSVLENIKDLRDVVELGNGYWLPAPIRFISLPNDKAFIVGGVSTRQLTKMLGVEIKLHSYIRYIKKSELPKTILDNRNLWQSYEDWLGRPSEDLKTWTEIIFSEARQILRNSAQGFHDFEIYYPIGSYLQYYRWIHFDNYIRKIGRPSANLVLCRTSSRVNKIVYWLGNITSTGMKNEAPILDRHVLRLQYGLDLINNVSTKAVCRQDGIIEFKNYLPIEERRLFIAVGQDLTPVHGKFPIRYRVRPEWQDLILSVVEKLGIQYIKEGKR